MEIHMENEVKIEKKDGSKEKIILFVIGVLVGAVMSMMGGKACCGSSYVDRQ